MKKYELCKISKRILTVLCAGMLTFSGTVHLPGASQITARAEDAKIVSLYASYTGPSVLVGDEIDEQYLVVSATYSDGVTDEIKDYAVVSKTVVSSGTNIGTVIYQGKTANYYVQGKTLKSIYATYTGADLSLGNTVGAKNVIVSAEYNDGSYEMPKDFTVIQTPITSIGKNSIPVMYKGVVTYITVYGVQPKTIVSLYATYSGGEVIVGSKVDPRDLIVSAVYKDGSTEEINNYSLTPSVIPAIGTQNVVASYHGSTASFSVVGAERKVTGIKVQYKGDPIGVGSLVRDSDIMVTATYNDGSTEVVKGFTVMTPSVSYVGYHVMTVEYGGCQASFIIEAVAAQAVNYSNAATFSITNNTNTAQVAIALPKNVAKTSIKGESLRTGSVTSVLSRAVRKSTFIAFSVSLTDDDVIEEFPLTMKITLPTEFNSEYVSLYYTPNRKSVIGKMNTEADGARTLICTIYHPGTYILSYKK